MKLPVLLFGPLTGQVYICTRGKIITQPDGHSYFRADRKFDVTEAFDDIVKARRLHLRREKRRVFRFHDAATPTRDGV